MADTDTVTQADMDRLTKSVDAFNGFKTLFQRPDSFTEDVNLAMRAIRAKFLGSGDRLTALLADVLGQKRPTNLSDASNMHDRLKQFGFGAPRPISLNGGIRVSTPIDESTSAAGDTTEKETAGSVRKSPVFKPLRQPQERGSASSRGVRIVAMTFQSRSRKYFAVSSPKPDEHPVIKMVFMRSLEGK